MQGDIDFLVRVAFFTGISTYLALRSRPTQNRIRHWAYVLFGIVVSALSLWYWVEQSGYTSFAAELGGPWTILAALFWFVAAACAIFIVDLYYNVDELRNDPAYNMYGDIGLAILTVGTAQLALLFATLPWYLSDPTIFEIKSTIRYIDGVSRPEDILLLDIFWFSLDQTGKAVLFDIAEVYRFGLTNLSNNPEHLPFSTFCLIYRTLVAVYVTVIAYRLIFAPKQIAPK